MERTGFAARRMAPQWSPLPFDPYVQSVFGERTGRWGSDRFMWMWHPLTGGLFRLGRLQCARPYWIGWQPAMNYSTCPADCSTRRKSGETSALDPRSIASGDRVTRWRRRVEALVEHAHQQSNTDQQISFRNR